MTERRDTAAGDDRSSHITVTDEEALELHRQGRPGKIEVVEGPDGVGVSVISMEDAAARLGLTVEEVDSLRTTFLQR